MFEKHKAEKAAKAQQAGLADWQSQRDGYAHLLEVAEGFHGAGTNEIMLKAGEALFYKVTGCALVEERRGAGHYQGHSTGVSVPIGSLGGRSVRYRVGANRGHFVAGAPVPTAIDSGTMYITNQRVVFAGTKQTRECLFAKTIGIAHDDVAGETTISVSNRQKPTVIHYGPEISGDVDFRFELAIAHFKGTLDDLVDQMRTQLAAIDAHRPGGLVAGPGTVAAPASAPIASTTMSSTPSGPTPSAPGVPLAAAPVLPLVEPPDRDSGWEYLYLASELARGLDACAPQYTRYQSQATDAPGVAVADPAAYVHVLTDQLSAVVSGVNHALAADVLERAVGKPGEQGDEAAIRAVASELTGIYAAMISWGIAVRSVTVDPKWHSVYSALANYVSLPLHQFQDFSVVFSAAVTRVMTNIRAGKPAGEEINLALTVSIDPTASAQFDTALAVLRAMDDAGEQVAVSEPGSIS